MAATSPLFRTVQFEFAGELDIDQGRWMLRGHAARPRAVLLIQVSERPRRRLGRNRNKGATDGPLPLTQVTVIDTDPIEGSPTTWLEEADERKELRRGLKDLAALLDLGAVATAQTQPQVVRRRDLVGARVGYGSGEFAAAGNFAEKREIQVALNRPRANERTGPSAGAMERLTDLLSGRDIALASERLALRARNDLNNGRSREAALQLRVAIEVAIAELEAWRAIPSMDPLLNEMRNRRAEVAELASSAARGGLSEAHHQSLTELLDILEDALNRRAQGYGAATGF